MHGSCFFYVIVTISLVALDVKAVLALQSAWCSRGGYQAHDKYRAFLNARIYGRIGGRSTNNFGGLVGWNCTARILEWLGFKSSSSRSFDISLSLLIASCVCPIRSNISKSIDQPP